MALLWSLVGGVLASLCAVDATPTAWSASMKNFGHSIKNGESSNTIIRVSI